MAGSCLNSTGYQELIARTGHLAPNPPGQNYQRNPLIRGPGAPVPGGRHASSTPQGLKSGVDVSTAKNLWPAAPTARVPMKRDFGNLPCFPVRYGEVIEKRMRPVCTFPGRSGRRTERVMGQVSLRCICAPKRTVSAGYNFDYAYIRGSTSSLSHLPPRPEGSKHWFVMQIRPLV